jgi:hypothetical protein
MVDTETDQWTRVCDKFANGGFESLSHSEQIWVSIRELIDSIENGGLVSYFYNSGADRLETCLSSLDELDASSVRQLLLRECALFGQKVPSTVEARNASIESWDSRIDDELEEIDESIMPLTDELENKLHRYLVEQNCISQ